MDKPTFTMGATALICACWCIEALIKGPCWMAIAMAALAILNTAGTLAHRRDLKRKAQR